MLFLLLWNSLRSVRDIKKDDNLIRGNYRPISVIPVLSKLYEIVMNEQLFNYFVDKFYSFLSAFRKRYSCQSLLLKTVDDWKCALDQSLFTGVVFYGSVESFRLFTSQFTDCETPCVWCWFVRRVPGPVARFAALAANLGPAPATILARGHIRRRVRHQQLMHFAWRFTTLFKWCHWWHRHYKSCTELWKVSAKISVNVVLWSPLVTDLNPF